MDKYFPAHWRIEDLWLLTFPVFFFFTDGIYRIVYEEVDESDVKIFCFPSSNSNFGEVEEFR
jgi:hypothetical protein